MPGFVGARRASLFASAARFVLPTPVLLEGFESLTGITGTGAAVALTSSPKVQGANSLKRTATGFGASSIFTASARAINTDAANLKTIAAWQNFEAPYYSVGGLTPAITVGGTVYTAPQYGYVGSSPMPGRWVAFHADDFVNGGTPLSGIGPIGNADVKFTDAIAAPFYTPAETDALMYNAAGRPTLIITLDDGYVSQYTRLYPLLQKYGITASFAPIKNYVQANQATQLTPAQMAEMYAAGMDFICDGTADDMDPTAQANMAAAMTNLNGVRSWLQGLGLTRGADHIVWPFGIFERSVRVSAATLSLTLNSNVVVVDSAAAASIQLGQAVFAHPSTGIGGLTVTGVSGTNITLSGNAAVTSTSYRARFVFTDDANAPFYGSKLLDSCRANGFKTGRTVGAAPATGNQLYSRFGMGGQELCYPARSFVYSDTAAGVLADVDRAIKLGTTLGLFSHDIQDTTSASTPNSVATAVWDSFLAGVAQRVAAGLLDVITPAQWHARDIANPAALPF